MIFPGGFGQHRTRIDRIRSWRLRRRVAHHGVTALGIAHHHGMVEALRVATAAGRIPSDTAER
jgi:hypothetical protein